ncbi:MAG: PIN domain-containing protein [Myxococcota bacterium]
MSERTFIDTNVLIYADDDDSTEKRDIARATIRQALETGSGVLSTQILQEYFVNATRKLGMRPEQARARIEQYLAMDIITVETDRILAAIDLHRLRGLSFWDAVVVRCAIDAGCKRLLTEDLQDGQRIQGVRIENPFAEHQSAA